MRVCSHCLNVYHYRYSQLLRNAVTVHWFVMGISGHRSITTFIDPKLAVFGLGKTNF